MLYNLDNLMEWTKLNSKKDVIKALQRMGIPFAELHNGEVVTLYSALEKGFNNQLVVEGDEMIRLDEVLKLTKVCRATIHNYERDGLFPQKVKLGPKKIAWKKTAVLQWVDGKRDW